MYFILLLISLSTAQTIEYKSTHTVSPCRVTFTGVDLSPVTYNLCPLTLSESTQPTSYSVQDSRYDNHPYIYQFNIGDTIPSSDIPSICKNQSVLPGYCIEGSNNCNGDNIIDITGDVWAYQILEDNNNNPIACYPLSNEVGGPPQFSLINTADPTEGIRLTFLNGDYSPDCEKNRIFNIEFVCENNANFIPTQHAIYETDSCEYTLRIFSIYGCPSECNRYDNQICGNNGLCGYDFMSKIAKCFCYYGYIGDDCMIEKEEDDTLYKSTKTLPEEDILLGYTHTFTKEETGSVEVDYDIIDFRVDEGVYIVHNINKQFQVFYFGLVPLILPKYDPTSVLPDFCNNITMPCININEITGECLEFKPEVIWGMVFMVDFTKGSENCIALSTSVPQWELYDKENPARGVIIVYPNGSYCPDAGKNREFRSHLVCPMDQESQFNTADEVQVNLYEYYNDDEYGCSYSGIQETAVACPWQCITEHDITQKQKHLKEFSVCSKHGICAADKYPAYCILISIDDGYNNDFYCRNQTNSPTLLPTISPIISPSNDNDNEIENKNINNKNKNSEIIIIVILICVVLLLLVICGICLRREKLQNKVLQSKIDDQEYTKFAGDTHANTIMNEDGARGFATIPVTAGADDDDDRSDDISD